MSGWVQTWSAVAARRGEFRSVSDWLGVDVDHSSAPVLSLADGDSRITTQDALLDARSRHALALLSHPQQRRPGSSGGAGGRKARARQHFRHLRAMLRSRG